jgi:hypothetical protein
MPLPCIVFSKPNHYIVIYKISEKYEKKSKQLIFSVIIFEFSVITKTITFGNSCKYLTMLEKHLTALEMAG